MATSHSYGKAINSTPYRIETIESNRSKRAKRWYYSAAHWHTVNV